MLTVLSILAVLAVLFVAAAVATREGPILADAPVDMADLELPAGPLQPEDLRAVRFALAVRGYRMDEVDRVIERAASELAARDERILELERTKAEPVAAPAATVVLAEPAPPPPAPAVELEPVEEPEPGAVDVPETVDVPAALDERDADETSPDEPEPPDAPGEPEADREPVASLLVDADDGSDDAAVDATSAVATSGLEADETAAATTEVDAAEPPPPPPAEVAVVPTEVAPLPDQPAAVTRSSEASDDGAPTASPSPEEGAAPSPNNPSESEGS